MTPALKTAQNAAAIAFCVHIAALATTLASPPAHASESTPQDGIAAAVVRETDVDDRSGRSPAPEADGQVRPHWCNKTSTLIADIHKLGGYSVMRAEIGEGRTLERYWNASEEVVIEHGSDGTSCLVDLRPR